MKKLSFLAAALIATSALAGDHTLNLIGRAGLAAKDNDTKKSSLSNSSSFNMDFLRTTLAGNLNPSVRYLVTADLLAANGTTDSVDGASPFIDEAFITKTFSFGSSLSMGKKTVIIGGREYDYADYDRYTSSAFKATTPSNQVGVTLAHEVQGHTLALQYFNGNKNNGQSSTTNAQSKFGYSVSWNGNYHEMVKPILAYTVIPKTKADATADASTVLGTSGETRSFSGNDVYLAGGLQVNLPSGFILEGDYNLLTEKDAATVNAVKKDVKLTSVVAQLKYNTERCMPFAKFISENRKTDTTKTAERSAYDLGVEWKEKKDDAIRYHIVYSGSTVKTAMNTTEVKTSPSTILVGLKFDAAILK